MEVTWSLEMAMGIHATGGMFSFHILLNVGVFFLAKKTGEALRLRDLLQLLLIVAFILTAFEGN